MQHTILNTVSSESSTHFLVLIMFLISQSVTIVVGTSFKSLKNTNTSLLSSHFMKYKEVIIPNLPSFVSKIESFAFLPFE